MNTQSDQEPEVTSRAARFACGALAFLFGAAAAFILFNSISSITGWGFVVMALNFGHIAFTYTPASDTAYAVSRPRLFGILAVCAIPPLLLLFVFIDRPGWQQPLVVAFLLCISIGPVILLRRYTRQSNKSDHNPHA
jgi:glucan phosphoethanolaminetransferase (alkaline phosphatase superfamily)